MPMSMEAGKSYDVVGPLDQETAARAARSSEVQDLLARGLKAWHDYYELEELVDMIDKALCSLWLVIYNRSATIAMILAEEHLYEKRKVYQISYMAGKLNRNVVKALVGAVEGFCREHEFDEIQVVGRPGWERVLRDYDYRPKFHISGKEL